MWATRLYTRQHVDLSDPEVKEISNEGIAIGEQLVREYPASAEFRRDLANALEISEYRALKSGPTPEEAEHALSVFRQVLGLRQAILADLLAGRPETFQPRCPIDAEATMVYPGCPLCYGRHRLVV